jgi:hypothetical protein
VVSSFGFGEGQVINLFGEDQPIPTGVYVHFYIPGNGEYTEGYGWITDDDLELSRNEPEHGIPCKVEKWVVLGEGIKELLDDRNVVYFSSHEFEVQQ